jgi:Flp pilus assembly pilin Flp
LIRSLMRECPCDIEFEGWVAKNFCEEKEPVANIFQNLWRDERGQDIAEYAVMLAVILVIVVGTVRLIGSNANNVFSNVASSIQ